MTGSAATSSSSRRRPRSLGSGTAAQPPRNNSRSLGCGTVAPAAQQRGDLLHDRASSSLSHFCLSPAPSFEAEADDDASNMFPTSESLAPQSLPSPPKTSLPPRRRRRRSSDRSSHNAGDGDDISIGASSVCSAGSSFSLGVGTFPDCGALEAEAINAKDGKGDGRDDGHDDGGGGLLGKMQVDDDANDDDYQDDGTILSHGSTILSHGSRDNDPAAALLPPPPSPVPRFRVVHRSSPTSSSPPRDISTPRQTPQHRPLNLPPFGPVRAGISSPNWDDGDDGDDDDNSTLVSGISFANSEAESNNNDDKSSPRKRIKSAPRSVAELGKSIARSVRRIEGRGSSSPPSRGRGYSAFRSDDDGDASTSRASRGSDKSRASAAASSFFSLGGGTSSRASRASRTSRASRGGGGRRSEAGGPTAGSVVSGPGGGPPARGSGGGGGGSSRSGRNKGSGGGGSSPQRIARSIAESVKSRSPFKRGGRRRGDGGRSDGDTVGGVSSGGRSLSAGVESAPPLREPAAPPRDVGGTESGGESGAGGGSCTHSTPKRKKRGESKSLLNTTSSTDEMSVTSLTSALSQDCSGLYTVNEGDQEQVSPVVDVVDTSGSGGGGASVGSSRSFDLNNSVELTSVYFEQHRALPLLTLEESWDEEGEEGEEEGGEEGKRSPSDQRAASRSDNAALVCRAAASRRKRVKLSASLDDAPPALCGRLSAEEIVSQIPTLRDSNKDGSVADALDRLRRLANRSVGTRRHHYPPPTTAADTTTNSAPPSSSSSSGVPRVVRIHGVAVPDYDDYVNGAVDEFRIRLGVSDRLYEEMKENMMRV